MEVFVFGSNQQGFHGAGAAGYAMRGDSKNNWRGDKKFKAAMQAPVGSPLRVGKLAVFGVAKGFQQGLEGASYAIVTVTRPGAKRSIPLEDILEQICELFSFAEQCPEHIFKCAQIGCGYAGYTTYEMMRVWNDAVRKCGKPENVILPSYAEVKVSDT